MKPELVLTQSQKKKRFEKHLNLREAIKSNTTPSRNYVSSYDSTRITHKLNGNSPHTSVEETATLCEKRERRIKRKYPANLTTRATKLQNCGTEKTGTKLMYFNISCSVIKRYVIRYFNTKYP